MKSPKSFLYIHGFGSDKNSYTGNTLKQLFPQYHWVLETFDLLNVHKCNEQIREIIRKENIDIVVSSSLGSIYNLFIKKEDDKMVKKIFINPCCFPSKELSKIAALPAEFKTLCEAVEYNIYERHPDNTPDHIFGIFTKDDELLHYHDFFAGRYGNYGEGGAVASSNCIWVEGKHSGLSKEVLNAAIQQAIDYFEVQEKKESPAPLSATEKPIVYVDMDGTLVDWQSGQDRLTELERLQYDGCLDEVPGLFSRMEPMPGGVNALYRLSEKYDVYILSTSPWLNDSGPSDKLRWIQKYFGKDKDSLLYKKFILSHHKELNKGDFLIDDRPAKNGTDGFEGKLVHFGSEEFPDWETVTDKMMQDEILIPTI